LKKYVISKEFNGLDMDFKRNVSKNINFYFRAPANVDDMLPEVLELIDDDSDLDYCSCATLT
jgi:hypothetical protein